MATYAALASLSNTLDQILNALHHPHHFVPLKKQQIESLYEYVSFLQDSLETACSVGGDEVVSSDEDDHLEANLRDAAQEAEYVIESPWKKQHIESLREYVSFLQGSQKTACSVGGDGVVSSDEDDHLEANIRDAVQEAEYVIESHIRNHLLLGSENEDGYKSFKMCCQGLDSILQRLDLLKNDLVIKVRPKNPTLPVRSSRTAPSRTSILFGINNGLKQVVNLLTDYPARLQIIRIFGMEGLGKTTLAKIVYNHPVTKRHFDICAWITVSQKYRFRNIILGLLKQTIVLTPQILKATDEKLKEYLYKSLRGKRYLIVMDDVWSCKPLDDVQKCLPDDNTGSRILLTTRVRIFAAEFSSIWQLYYEMKFLRVYESWQLLCRCLFGSHDDCPKELIFATQFLASKLRGLPILIVVLGGLLSKVKISRDFLEHVTNKILSLRDPDRWYHILRLSYIHLPYYLKPCFLYIGAFPEDHEICASRLFKLWAAEGFLRPTRFRTLEQTAEEYLMELNDRNLIFVQEWGSNGNIKTCGIHDILRDMCLKISREENFLYFSDRRHLHSTLTGVERECRVAVDSDDLDNEYADSDDHDTDNDDPLDFTGIPVIHQSNISSFLFVGHPIDNEETSAKVLQFKLLRVFDAVNLTFIGFPEEILQLVNLRYLAFNCQSNIPSSISLLWNLQTLINKGSSDIPSGIWEMPWLKHVHFNKALLPLPIGGKKSFVLSSLETLSEVTNFRFTEEIVERLPSVRKLKIYYGNPASSNLYNLSRLDKVETLKITSYSKLKPGILQSLVFPKNLKKLTLSGCRIPWEYMTHVGSLHCLQVLKLEYHSFKGSVWQPAEGEFHLLRFLLLSELDLIEWRVEDSHFPNLERLVIDRCFQLRVIPLTISCISTLQLIKVINSSPGALNSARKIQKEQEDLGNSNLQLDIVNFLGHRLRK